MTVRGGKGTWIVGAGAGLTMLVVGGLLVRAGLEDADRWASITSMFLALAGLAISAYSIRRHSRAAPESGPSDGNPGPRADVTPTGDVDNHISGGTFAGPVIMGRDLGSVELPTHASQPPPPDATGGREPDR